MKRRIEPVICGLLVIAIAGCGSPVGVNLSEVSGEVKMNGLPLADAEVVFRPESGRMSYARTDESGHYDLVYIGKTKGALPGKHKVFISTLIEQDSDSADPKIREGRPESVAAKFNSMTILEADVPEKGAVVFNYEVEQAIAPNKLKRN